MNLTQSYYTPSLGTLFWIFLKIGSTAWGGFMPMIAVIQSYLRKKNLLQEQDVLDAIFLASILPGPMAFNVVVGVGYRLRGFSGALVCGIAALLPTFILVLGLSIAYFQLGEIPVVDKLFMGFTPAMVAIIISAAWSMANKTIKGVPEIAISVMACAILLGIGGFYSTLGIIIASGLTGWLLFRHQIDVPSKPYQAKPQSSSKWLSISTLPAVGLLAVKPSLILTLFSTFATMSVTLFGSGYVFIPIIQDLVVNNQGWLTEQQFIDGLAISQITPGPILISSAFIGYKVAGLLGAISATAGMFGPPALLMLVGTYFLDSFKSSIAIQAALQGVRPAVVGMLMAAAVVVSKTAMLHWASAWIFIVAIIALIRFRLDVVLIIPVAGIAGLLLF